MLAQLVVSIGSMVIHRRHSGIEGQCLIVMVDGRSVFLAVGQRDSCVKLGVGETVHVLVLDESVEVIENVSVEIPW